MSLSTFVNAKILASVVCWTLLPSPPQALAEAADQVFISDAVITMVAGSQRRAAPLALATRDERIVWIGAHADAGEWIGDQTEVWQLGEQAVLPGFIDAHGHVVFSSLAATLANVASPPVGPAQDIAGVQAALRAYITERAIAPGEWVVGMGYDDSLLAEQRHPNRHDLDAVTDQHPVILIHVSGHLMAANSRALARGGITSESEDPPGGLIRRDALGVPNGVLEETAMAPLREFRSAPNVEPLTALAATLEDYASRGITTVQDGASNAESVALLRAAAEAGLLTLDVTAYPVGMADPQATIDGYDFGSYRDRLKIGGIKLVLDGSPQGKTAYLTAPYAHPPHGQGDDYRGYPTIPQARVSELVAAYLDAGVPILAHANGDAAADMLIDAVAEAGTTHDHRTVMIHAQTVREDQLTRMKTLRMIPSYFSAHTFYWGDWHRDSVFGIERASRISPTASTVARGMPFTVHNDAPIVPPDMLRLLWATTNRRTRSDALLGGDQRISTYEALRAVTVHAAYQNFEEAEKGTLEVGKLADIVVLSEDPLAVATQELLAVEVRATVSRGRLVYRGDGLRQH